MKSTLGIIILFILISCSDDVRPSYDIYNEWQWVKSTFDTRGRPITSHDVDSTHYYTFTKEGKLIVKNNSRRNIKEFDVVFEVNDNSRIFRIQDSDVVFGYGINSDTLTIWQANSIWPQRNIYKLAK
jgi:YD repeat-containing protein